MQRKMTQVLERSSQILRKSGIDIERNKDDLEIHNEINNLSKDRAEQRLHELCLDLINKKDSSKDSENVGKLLNAHEEFKNDD